MLPNLPILRRSSYQSAFSGANYNPRTLITRLIESDVLSLSTPNDYIQLFEYNATSLHERVHWFQHHGTSFGCFLEWLRISQICTTLRHLRATPTIKVRELIAQRTSDSKPILEFNPQEQYPIFDKCRNNYELDTFRQIWFDHQWLHMVLEDSSILQSGLKLIPGNAIGEVVSDVMLALHELDILHHREREIWTDYFESRKWFAIPEKDITFVSCAKKCLTSKLLMECAATISEVQLLRNNINTWLIVTEKFNLLNALKNRVERIAKGDYGLPIRIFIEEIKSDSNLLFDFLPTVNVLCFIALNPPLPPYVMNPPPNASSWSWQDIYPPVRFIRLVQCVNKVGLLDDWLDHKTISDYIDKICDICQIPHTINMNYPEWLRREDSLKFIEECGEYSDQYGTIHSDYICWVQSHMSHYRLNSLPLIMSLGDCLSGDLAVNLSQEILYQDTDFIPFSYSPFSWTNKNTLGFACPLNFGNALLRAVACNYAVFDLVTGIGKYDLSSFPDEVSFSEKFYNLIEHSIFRATTEVKNQ